MLRLAALFIISVIVGPVLVFAQTAREQLDIQFVEGLRARGDVDLALDYLKVLEKTSSPEFKIGLPLEMAKTQLAKAIAEQDKSRRQTLYRGVMEQMKKFIAANPSNPRTTEAKLDLANLSLLLAKTNISEIAANRKTEDKLAKASEARRQILDARNQLKGLIAAMNADLAKLQPSPEQKSLSDKISQAELDYALTFYDEAKTIVDTGKDKDRVDRANKITEASKEMEKIASAKPESDPNNWKARAWSALFVMENGEPKKARPKLNEILLAPPANKAANDAKRLARYFYLQVVKDAPEPSEKNVETIIEKNGQAWLTDYKGYLKTPEGYGVRMLLAKNYIDQYKKTPATNAQLKTNLLSQARRQLSEIEQAENEFTDEAKNLKLNLMKEQGAFSKKVSDLKSFEDFYTRAQYEISQIAEEEGKATNAEDLEKKRKARTDAILESLKLGLDTKEAKETMKKGGGQNQYEVNNARAMLAFYHLNQKNIDQAILVGKQFVIDDPRSTQAAITSIYTLGAYGQKIAEMEKAGAPEDKLTAMKNEMSQFAKMMMDRWPGEPPGDSARHQVGLFLVKDKKYVEAVKLMEVVTPNYHAFPFCMYELGNAALSAEGEVKDGSFRAKAVKAFESIGTLESGGDPSVAKVYFVAKSKLGSEYYTLKKFSELQKLSEILRVDLNKYRLDLDQAKDDEVRKAISSNLESLGMFAFFGLSASSFDQGKFADVSKTLDPIVDKASSGALPEIKANPQLGSALFGMALRANIQIGDIEKSRKVLKALSYLSADADASGSNVLLLQLNALIRDQIQELRKKNDAKALETSKKGFTVLLDDVVKQQKKLSNELIRLVALNYSTMELNAKALELLKSAEKPKDDSDPKAKALYQGIELLMLKEYRILKQFDEANKLMDSVMGNAKTPGWGAKNIDALLERIRQLEAQDKYGNASSQANALVKQLVTKSASDNQVKEKYLEAYFHTVYALYKYGLQQTDAAKKASYVNNAATLISNLVNSNPDFGSVDSKKRFDELLASEKELNDAFEVAKNRKPAPAATNKGGTKK